MGNAEFLTSAASIVMTQVLMPEFFRRHFHSFRKIHRRRGAFSEGPRQVRAGRRGGKVLILGMIASFCWDLAALATSGRRRMLSSGLNLVPSYVLHVAAASDPMLRQTKVTEFRQARGV